MSEKNTPASLVIARTRRQAIAFAGAAFGGLAASAVVWGGARQGTAQTQSAVPEKLRTHLHQDIDMKVSAERVYNVLLDSKEFAAFTGLAAEINAKAGGAFSLFGGLIVGRNIELIPNKRIVQAWRPTSWTPGVYSIVEFQFEEHGPESKIFLDHTGFPEGKFDDLDSGWHERYWEPLKKFVA